ncbi:hypothetical protein RUND412_003600 [Rhizina undulata]
MQKNKSMNLGSSEERRDHHDTTGSGLGTSRGTTDVPSYNVSNLPKSNFVADPNVVSNIASRDHHNDTEVSETISPAITKETYRPIEREERVTAVDREIHQDHFQTRIQPIHDKEVLAEEHRHNVLPVEHREVRHGMDKEITSKLESERQKFHDTREVLPTQHTVSEFTATIQGEHAHHHVHENVQPVIEREIIQPSVVHTTVPIHERIEKAPTFHPATVQPKMTLEEYRRAGGTLEGKREMKHIFEGEPLVKENGGASQTHPYKYGEASSGTIGTSETTMGQGMKAEGSGMGMGTRTEGSVMDMDTGMAGMRRLEDNTYMEGTTTTTTHDVPAGATTKAKRERMPMMRTKSGRDMRTIRAASPHQGTSPSRHVSSH